ncbi:MAG TPA: EF-P lysine aminoacylase EpmA [Pseudomonadota bacterium]|nr:EF-P lysine aminoacylase EpmA [Pseudomonadota bacterium]HQX25759.1 EF-P lysine aminoacylase EpmA [Pseudomonadota bacterium]HRA36198.1 EF-P lysine aminoacylase EpmA [Pseudomonadota bacterium]
MSDWRPSATPAALRLRARLYQWLREYFAARGVLEVETPMLSAAGNTDPNIESFRTRFNGHVDAGAAQRWLRTSPEYPLKRLLAAGIGDCYEIGRVFRDGEAGGRHNPEFTMLEWYRVGWDHHRLMVEVGEIVRGALALVARPISVRTLGYRELFLEYAGLDPHQCEESALRRPLAGFAIRDDGLTRDDWLDLLLTHRIEPQLRDDTLLLVHDYPASQAALARIRPGTPPLAERFEAMLGGIELANGYHELADPGEQDGRFGADLARRRSRGAVEPPPDARLIEALAHGLPGCAGVALGLDRLLMAMQGTRRIADVLAFDFGRA